MFKDAFVYIKVFLIVNVGVILALAYLSLLTNSVALLAFTVDKTLDTLSNIISIYGISKAKSPPDADHHYGHAKFEVLSRFMLSMLLFISVFQIISQSIERLLYRKIIPKLDLFMLIILLFVSIVNFSIFFIGRIGGVRTRVKTLIAESYNYLQDTLTTIILLFGVYFSTIGYWYIDPILGIIISFIIFRLGWDIFRESYTILTDVAPIDKRKIKEFVEKFKNVIQCTDIASRTDGFFSYLELTIKVDPKLSVEEAHELTEKIEKAIKEKFSSLNFKRITIHVEPSKV